MKSLEKNIEYQILTLRLKLIEFKQNEIDFMKKYGYEDRLKKYRPTIKILNHQLETIKNELKGKYNSLEIISDNLPELQRIANILLCFETVDKSILLEIESKITELITIKETSLKEYDFITANHNREEIRKLQNYISKHSLK